MKQVIYESIKQYLNRDLSESDRFAFENQLKTDPEFAEEVATWAAIYQGLQEHGDEKLSAELTELGKTFLQQQTAAPDMHAKTNPEKLKSRFEWPRWAYAAAALILLLVIALPLYQKLGNNDNTYASAGDLYAKHFKLPAVEGVRGNNGGPWRTAYEQRKFPEAIAALEQLLSDPENRRPSNTHLYLGLSQLGLSQAAQAVASFEQVSPNSEEWSDAQWYTALAYLKLNDITKAKTMLQAIKNEARHPWQAEAAEILKQLKE